MSSIVIARNGSNHYLGAMGDIVLIHEGTEISHYDWPQPTVLTCSNGHTQPTAVVVVK